ncbi:hypothetical protein [Nocardia sp. alder85J]|uniref:hypothetical protein n=1 Tax=Nocardia sp. alder85J TaxID=2862949 RepID=UPI001CD811C1|nr:hypothetical protein [Nocardia sp. alder85J]MCX4099139.1 hypothetical protein [Nocardia sp. alder85J]
MVIRQRGPRARPLSGPSVADIARRLAAEPPEPAKHGGRVAVWPLIWTHEAPEIAFTVAAAHLVMQQHRKCPDRACPRKRAALRVLVDAGHAVPDARALNRTSRPSLPVSE